MFHVVLPLLWLAAVPGEVPPAPCVLFEPAAVLDAELRAPARPYTPQPGDVVLATDRSKIICIGHKMAGSHGVHHSSIVVALPDGRPAVLEAGPFNGLRVEIVDPLVLLTGHEKRGEQVWIRQRRVPLTPEQSACLTRWAVQQDGKLFAGLRMMWQLTPIRARGPFTEHLGKPHGARMSYFCSELVTESCIAAGLVDPTTARPTATYPRDLFFDRSANRYLDEHPLLANDWLPPARWTTCP